MRKFFGYELKMECEMDEREETICPSSKGGFSSLLPSLSFLILNS